MASPVKTDELLGALALAPYCYDPLGFVESQYPWGDPEFGLADETGPRDWQAKVLTMVGEHFANPETRHVPFQLAIASGHGIGKSALMAWLTHWSTCTFPDTVGMITANTENQLRTKTWREQNTWFGRLACRRFFRSEGMSLKSRERPKTWTFDAQPWSESNTDAVQGYHNKGKRLVILIDEASGVPYVIMNPLMGALTDEDTEIILIVFGNPTQPTGFFADCFGRNRNFWHHLQIDSRDVPGTNKVLFEQWEKQYGADSDFFRVRVRGLFPKSAFDQLIPFEYVEQAQEQDVAPRISDPLILGVDVARYGDDAFVIYPRKGKVAGLHGGPWVWRDRADTLTNAHRVAKLMDELNPDAVNIDGGGPGGGVVDVLRDWKRNVNEVAFGGASSNPDYANKRAQMWYDMRDWLKDGGSIPWNDTDLSTDLTNVTYQYQQGKSNALILTPKEAMKKDGLPSPDFGDALALTFAVPVNPRTSAAARLAADNASDTEYRGGWE